MPAGIAAPHPAAMHIRDWPADERPREKLLARGAAALSDAELLAIFLGSGTAGRSRMGEASSGHRRPLVAGRSTTSARAAV